MGNIISNKHKKYNDADNRIFIFNESRERTFFHVLIIARYVTEVSHIHTSILGLCIPGRKPIQVRMARLIVEE